MTSLNFDIYLRCTPEQIWTVLTDPAIVLRERVGMSLQPDPEAAPMFLGQPDEEETGAPSPPGQRLACEWLQTDHLAANGGRPSVVSFALIAMGEVTRLSLSHTNLAPDGSFLKVVAPGWPILLSSLKSLVETGEPLEFGTGEPDPARRPQAHARCGPDADDGPAKPARHTPGSCGAHRPRCTALDTGGQPAGPGLCMARLVRRAFTCPESRGSAR